MQDQGDWLRGDIYIYHMSNRGYSISIYVLSPPDPSSRCQKGDIHLVFMVSAAGFRL